MSTTRKTAGKPLATLKIGHSMVLLPADAALKVAALLSGAVECDEDWDRSTFKRHIKVESGALRCAVEMIDPKQVRMPEGAEPEPVPARPLRLGRS